MITDGQSLVLTRYLSFPLSLPITTPPSVPSPPSLCSYTSRLCGWIGSLSADGKDHALRILVVWREKLMKSPLLMRAAALTIVQD